MQLRLSYFKFPFWRAEVSRIALFLGDVPFENHHPSRDEFKKMKAAGELPFGQLPILLVDGQVIAQTGAIARFCGKLSGLYPEDNALHAARVDAVRRDVLALVERDVRREAVSAAFKDAAAQPPVERHRHRAQQRHRGHEARQHRDRAPRRQLVSRALSRAYGGHELCSAASYVSRARTFRRVRLLSVFRLAFSTHTADIGAVSLLK